MARLIATAQFGTATRARTKFRTGRHATEQVEQSQPEAQVSSGDPDLRLAQDDEQLTPTSFAIAVSAQAMIAAASTPSLPMSGPSTNWMSVTTPGATATGSSGNDNIATDQPDTTLVGGFGDDIYTVGTESVSILENAGQGIDTVQVWTGEGYALALDQSLENLTLMGASNAWGSGNGLANIVTGNTGDNLLDGKAGNDQLTGGGGHDVFVFAAGQGSEVITDFATAGPGQDWIRLDGFNFTSFSQVKAAMVQSGPDTVLTIPSRTRAGQTLTLRNVSLSALGETNVLLPLTPGQGLLAGASLTFNDDFISFSRSVNGAGTWATRFVWGGDSAYTDPGSGEQQLFVDPEFHGLTATQAATPLGLNPFATQNGKLVITAAPIPVVAGPYTSGYQFFSGMISSEQSFWQTYGYFEITASLPMVSGAWPAFWLLKENHVAPSELDVLEALGDRHDEVHVQTHAANSGEMMGSWVPVGGPISGTHRYGVLWTPYQVSFTLDGVIVGQYATPEDMDSPMYLIASLGMGGSWGGPAELSATAQMAIDAIKVYQLPQYTLAKYSLLSSKAPIAWLTASSAGQSVVGSSLSERLDDRGFAVQLSGSTGDDTYSVSNPNTRVVEEFGQGVDTIISSISVTLPDNVENCVLTGNAALAVTGNAMPNILTGNACDNTIRGGPGNDILTGGGGRDTFILHAGDGSDILTDFQAGSAAGSDVVSMFGYAFTSFIDIAAAMHQIGADAYLQLSETETLVFRNQSIGAFVSSNFQLPGTPPTSGTPIRFIYASATNQALYGTSAPEAFVGDGGRDLLAGEGGDDSYYISSKSDTTIQEKLGEGVDTVYVSGGGSYILPSNIENLVLQSGGSAVGNTQGNFIQGSSANDVLDGGLGTDWLMGGDGADQFRIVRGTGLKTIMDFHGGSTSAAQHDLIDFAGYGPGATLSHSGDLWQIRTAAGIVDQVRITGVTTLGAGDYIWS